MDNLPNEGHNFAGADFNGANDFPADRSHVCFTDA
jgi:hypothetical protein